MRTSALFLVLLLGALLCVNNGFRSFPARSSRHAQCHSRVEVATEKQSVNLGDDNGAAEKTLVFAGVKFKSPIAQMLPSLGISEPTPIQKAAIAPVTAGLTCVLHAQTGSGKTLAYLLPLMKRLSSYPPEQMPRLQAFIMVPTKELAVQVAADISTLLGLPDGEEDTYIHLSLTSRKSGFDKVTCPIVVGTPVKILDSLRQSVPDTVQTIKYIVLDEVDRLLAVSGRYATLRDKRANKREERPVIEILRKIFYRRSRSEFAQIQVVAASATVGRPLRRELSKIVSADGEYGDLTVIRPEAGDEIYSSIKQTGRERMKASPPKKTKKKGDFLDELYNDLDELNIENEHDGDDGDADDRDMDTDILKDPDFGGPQQAAKPQRPIGIPDAIEHVAYLADQENMNLAKKIGFVRGIWKGVREGSRGILFVPKEDDVKQTVGMLNFWGLDAEDLRDALGVQKDERNTWKRRHRNDMAPKKKEAVKKLSMSEMMAQARRNKLGTGSGLTSQSDSVDVNVDGDDDGNAGKKLFVVPVSGARGLHLRDVSHVLIAEVPRTMDEYLHMAGRTGRAGNIEKGGKVTSLVTLEEMKRLKSWQTPLGIEYRLQYPSY